jgi:hypothetical protein
MDNIISNITLHLKKEIQHIILKIKFGVDYNTICNEYIYYNKSMLDFICDKQLSFFDDLFLKIYYCVIMSINNRSILKILLNHMENHYLFQIKLIQKHILFYEIYFYLK